MSERKTAFVTGATGFLGSHLAHRLLRDGYRVVALARPSRNTSAQDRVYEVMKEVGDVSLENLQVIEGDISQPGLGMDETAARQLVSKLDEVWHVAASLSFQQEDRDEIFRMNVDGTKHVIDIVAQTSSRRLHHVSTAYVAGNRPDVALETEIYVGQTFKNAYEESKCKAELIVADCHSKGTIVSSVYRPSIVIGDSTTGQVTHFHGVYAFIRGLWGAVERLRRRMPAPGIVNLPFRVLGRQDTTLNFVPINYVVDGMVSISRSEASIGQTYHLANPVPTENRFWLPHICRILGVEGIQLVGENSFLKEPMTRLEALFQKQMAFYYQYLQGEPRFDCSRTANALANTGIHCPPVTVEFVDRIVGWYIDFLSRSRVEA